MVKIAQYQLEWKIARGRTAFVKMLDIYCVDKDVSTLDLAVGMRKWIGHRWTNHAIFLALASSAWVSRKTGLAFKMQTLPDVKHPYSFTWEGPEEEKDYWWMLLTSD